MKRAISFEAFGQIRISFYHYSIQYTAEVVMYSISNWTGATAIEFQVCKALWTLYTYILFVLFCFIECVLFAAWMFIILLLLGIFFSIYLIHKLVNVGSMYARGFHSFCAARIYYHFKIEEEKNWMHVLKQDTQRNYMCVYCINETVCMCLFPLSSSLAHSILLLSLQWFARILSRFSAETEI